MRRGFTLAEGTRLFVEPHRCHVALLIGGWSPRLAKLASLLADEPQAGGGANPGMVPVLAAMADKGTARRFARRRERQESSGGEGWR